MGRVSCSEPPDSAAIAQGGVLETETLDVAEPKNRRPARNRPEPAQELRDWEKQARARAEARPYPPGIILEPAGFDEEHWTAPHSDTSLWTLQLADALGTRSQAVISAFMAQIEALCGKQAWDEKAHQWRLDENEFSAALTMVSSFKPRNEMEAALAVQMVAVHLMQMKLAASAIKFSYDSKTAAVAGKLARTFVQQIEAMQRLRAPNRTKRQSIRVRKKLHQHVHYHGHGGTGKNASQPHEPPAPESGECAALPGPQPRGASVPRTSRKRETGV
jgi:hypothetical protein